MFLNSLPQSSPFLPAISIMYNVANATFNQPKAKLSEHARCTNPALLMCVVIRAQETKCGIWHGSQMGLVFRLKLFIVEYGPLESCCKAFCCTRLYALRRRKLWFEGCLKSATRKAVRIRCEALRLRGSVSYYNRVSLKCLNICFTLQIPTQLENRPACI